MSGLSVNSALFIKTYSKDAPDDKTVYASIAQLIKESTELDKAPLVDPALFRHRTYAFVNLATFRREPWRPQQ